MTTNTDQDYRLTIADGLDEITQKMRRGEHFGPDLMKLGIMACHQELGPATTIAGVAELLRRLIRECPEAADALDAAGELYSTDAAGNA